MPTRLPRSHPFVQLMLQAEVEEKRAGGMTDKVLDIRERAKRKFPRLYEVYFRAKRQKQHREAMLPIQERDEKKRERRIRNYSILKGRREIPGFGTGVGEL